MNLEKTGKFISELRKKKGFTQVELGELVGVTGKAVSKWENGQSLPDVSILNSLSEILGVTTTELLNGDYLDMNNQENIDDVTENSINFYKDEVKKKFHTTITILWSIIISLTTVILAIFVYNNYNSCQIYSVVSQNSEIKLTGVLNITNKKNILMITDLKYSGTNIQEVNVLSYSLKSDDVIYYQSGNPDEHNDDKDSEIVSFGDFLKNINIYLSDDKNGLKLDKIFNGHLNIVIDYLSDSGTIYQYVIPLSLKREFSNTKLFY